MSHRNEQSIDDLLAGLKKAIWQRRPILGEIMEKHGDKNLFRYAADFLDVNPSPILDARKGRIIAVTEKIVEERLGKQVASGVAKQLTKLPLVSTTDHHGPIDHPFFVNANLISSIPYFESTDQDMRYLVVLSFASVSVNNADAYPRGILFHGGLNGSGNFIRLPILPDKLKMGVVYGTRSFTREDLTKAEVELTKKEKVGEIAPGLGDKVRALLEKYFGTEDVLQAPDLAAQVTKINYHIWPSFFHKGVNSVDATEPTARIPDLVYVEIETLVTELLISDHLMDSSSPMSKLLFDPTYRALALKHFNNISGGFSMDKGWGSYMFWAVDERLHRVRLELEGNTLVSHARGYRFELTPETIGQALREKKIFPSMLLCYLMVSLYYGMKCLGGFCQVHDLTMTKTAWGNLLREVGEDVEADAIAPVQTRELGGDGLALAYLRTVKGEMVPATGIDMALVDRDTTFQKYVERSKTLTLTEVMNPLLPQMYNVVYSANERDPELLAATPERILSETGLQEKLMSATDSMLREETYARV